MRVGELYTVVTLNGLGVYFHRLTVKIDGIGVTADCMQSESLPEVTLLLPGADSSPQVHK